MIQVSVESFLFLHFQDKISFFISMRPNIIDQNDY